jgi:beta-lactamase regulating signal transducer with metallopeptidase domain/HEAT repeat protein
MENSTLALLFLKVTVLVLAGAAAAASLRRANAGTRHLVWLTTLVGLLVLPAVLGLAPLRFEVLPRALVDAAQPMALSHSAAAPVTARTEHPTVATEATAEGALVPRAAVTPTAGPPAWLLVTTVRKGVLAVWAGVALLLLAYFSTSVLAVRRILATAVPLEGPPWNALLAEAADRLDLAELPRLVASDRVDVPFAFGAWRATIVLPEKAEAWSEERRRLVLAHELAHVKRRDLLGHTLGRIACAVYWFHPLVWVAARRLRAESERACDDLVLRSGARASDYADHLLDILTSIRGPEVPAAALAMGRTREFEGRLLAILDPRLKRGVPRAQRIALLTGLGALFVMVAASVPSMPQASAAAQTAASPTRPSAAPAAVASPPGASSSARPSAHPAPKAAANDPEPADSEDPTDQGRPEMRADHQATLVRVLRSDSEGSVRRTAAWALAESRERDAANALATALHGDADAEVREMAAWALQGTTSESGAAALAEALRRDSSPQVRATSAWALGQRGRADVTALVAAASDASPEVREVALWALGNQGIDKAPGALGAALRDSDDRVRVAAAWALTQIHDPTVAGLLQTAFKAEKDEEVRRAFFHALVLVGEGSPEVIEWAFGSQDAELRKVAVQMLASRGMGPWPWPWPRPEPRPFP